MKRASSLALVTVIFLSQLSVANERPDHFEGKPSPSLEVALAHLTEYNQKLAELIAQETLSPGDLQQVHQLTYTLENALEKLGVERERLAELLEQVHKASEHADSQTVQSSGREYLKNSAPLTQ